MNASSIEYLVDSHQNKSIPEYLLVPFAWKTISSTDDFSVFDRIPDDLLLTIRRGANMAVEHGEYELVTSEGPKDFLPSAKKIVEMLLIYDDWKTAREPR